MKKLAVLMMIFSALPGFADEAQNIQLARDMIAAVNARDLDRLDDLIAPDMRRHSTATPGLTVNSLDDFKAFLKSDFATVPDSVINVDVIFGNDDHVGLRALYAGTQLGPMGPFPPSGKEMELPFIGILRVSGGKIAEMWVEWDNMHALTQLGHLDFSDSE